MTTVEVEALTALAARIAADVGEHVWHERSTRLTSPGGIATKSSASDLVTVLDREAERMIRERLAAARPGDVVMGEEFGLGEGDARVDAAAAGDTVRWCVDPIDGTSNFVHGHPMWCVSIGASDAEGPVAAAVAVPELGRLFTAGRGHGAHLNGARLSVSVPASTDRVLLATGFSYDPRRRERQWTDVAHLISAVADVRRSGSAAIDLCSVAAGEVDVYAEGPLNEWDIAAGRLIASEAGAQVVVTASPQGQWVTAGSAEAIALVEGAWEAAGRQSPICFGQ